MAALSRSKEPHTLWTNVWRNRRTNLSVSDLHQVAIWRHRRPRARRKINSGPLIHTKAHGGDQTNSADMMIYAKAAIRLFKLLASSSREKNLATRISLPLSEQQTINPFVTIYLSRRPSICRAFSSCSPSVWSAQMKCESSSHTCDKYP